MKKLMLFIIGTFILNSAFSQGIDLGIKAGANFASLTDIPNSSTKTGFVGGVFAGIKFTDKVGIQGDLLFSQQGADFDTGAVDLTYLNVPIVLKYYVFKKVNIHAGPQFGILIDDNIDQTVGSILAEPQSSEFSGVVGVGVDLILGLRLSGRYNFGLTDVPKSVQGKNSVFTIAAEWSFL